MYFLIPNGLLINFLDELFLELYILCHEFLFLSYLFLQLFCVDKLDHILDKWSSLIACHHL